MSTKEPTMKYRKKPIVIEATQFDRHQSILDWPAGVEMYGYREATGEMYRIPLDEGGIHCPGIETLEGIHRVVDGDWIITGIKGERYPCKPDIFEATYDLVEDEEENQQ